MELLVQVAHHTLLARAVVIVNSVSGTGSTPPSQSGSGNTPQSPSSPGSQISGPSPLGFPPSTPNQQLLPTCPNGEKPDGSGKCPPPSSNATPKGHTKDFKDSAKVQRMER